MPEQAVPHQDETDFNTETKDHQKTHYKELFMKKQISPSMMCVDLKVYTTLMELPKRASSSVSMWG